MELLLGLAVVALVYLVGKTMADATFDGKFLVLKDNFPGTPEKGKAPHDGWLGASHFNVTSPTFPIGTKIEAYHKNASGAGRAGPYTMIYGRLKVPRATTALAAKDICTFSTSVPFDFTNDPDLKVSSQGMRAGMMVVALGVISSANYGFWLCGGVIPTDDVVNSAGTKVLDGNFKTDDGLGTGPLMMITLTSDAIGITSLLSGTTDGTHICVGYSSDGD